MNIITLATLGAMIMSANAWAMEPEESDTTAAHSTPLRSSFFSIGSFKKSTDCIADFSGIPLNDEDGLGDIWAIVKIVQPSLNAWKSCSEAVENEQRRQMEEFHSPAESAFVQAKLGLALKDMGVLPFPRIRSLYPQYANEVIDKVRSGKLDKMTLWHLRIEMARDIDEWKHYAPTSSATKRNPIKLKLCEMRAEFAELIRMINNYYAPVTWTAGYEDSILVSQRVFSKDRDWSWATESLEEMDERLDECLRAFYRADFIEETAPESAAASPRE